MLSGVVAAGSQSISALVEPVAGVGSIAAGRNAASRRSAAGSQTHGMVGRRAVGRSGRVFAGRGGDPLPVRLLQERDGQGEQPRRSAQELTCDRQRNAGEPDERERQRPECAREALDERSVEREAIAFEEIPRLAVEDVGVVTGVRFMIAGWSRERIPPPGGACPLTCESCAPMLTVPSFEAQSCSPADTHEAEHTSLPWHCSWGRPRAASGRQRIACF